MSQRDQCSRFQDPRSWQIRRDRRRCASCRYEWRPGMLPLRLTLGEWRRLLQQFVLGHSLKHLGYGFIRKVTIRQIVVYEPLPVRNVIEGVAPYRDMMNLKHRFLE